MYEISCAEAPFRISGRSDIVSRTVMVRNGPELNLQQSTDCGTSGDTHSYHVCESQLPSPDCWHRLLQRRQPGSGSKDGSGSEGRPRSQGQHSSQTPSEKGTGYSVGSARDCGQASGHCPGHRALGVRTRAEVAERSQGRLDAALSALANTVSSARASSQRSTRTRSRRGRLTSTRTAGWPGVLLPGDVADKLLVVDYDTQLAGPGREHVQWLREQRELLSGGRGQDDGPPPRLGHAVLTSLRGRGPDTHMVSGHLRAAGRRAGVRST